MPGEDEGVPSIEAAEEVTETVPQVPEGMELVPVGTKDKLSRTTSQIAPMQKAIEGIKGVGFESVDDAMQALSQYQSIRERQIPVEQLLQVWDSRDQINKEQTVSEQDIGGEMPDFDSIVDAKLDSFRKELATDEHNRRVQAEWGKVQKAASAIEDENQRQILLDAAENRFFKELTSGSRNYADGPLAGFANPAGVADSLAEYIGEQAQFFSGAPVKATSHSSGGPGGDNATEQPPKSSGPGAGGDLEKRRKAEALLARNASRRNGD